MITLRKDLILFILPLFILISVRAYAQSTFREERKVILIDPGHGGIDSGALSGDGLQEKDVVLDIALHMIAWNNSLLESKYDIYMTRNKDTLISLDDRTKLAKYLKPDVFISLHCNHIDDARIKGVELYTYGDNNISLFYVMTILKELNENLGFKTREPKQANFQVLKETDKYCPSMLLELGYLSNSDESDYLEDSENRKALALAVLMSI